MDDKMLQKLVEDISLTYFGRPFRHKAYFNTRLQTTGGRYHLNSHHIDFNKKVLETFGIDELIGVIKHELCHYHLHLLGKGYRHADSDFKALLAQVGGSRYVKNVKKSTVLWHYVCETCQANIVRKRRFNTNKYRCGRCGGMLYMVEKQ